MAIYAEVYQHDWNAQRPLELGYFNDQELNWFSLLIGRRRCLPIYLGECWRCQVCGVECDDLAEMAGHLLETHHPEPLNEEDLLELSPRRCA